MCLGNRQSGQNVTTMNIVALYCYYRVVQKNIAQSLTVILQPFAIESCGFHQNAQKLTGNTKHMGKFEYRD